MHPTSTPTPHWAQTTSLGHYRGCWYTAASRHPAAWNQSTVWCWCGNPHITAALDWCGVTRARSGTHMQTYTWSYLPSAEGTNMVPVKWILTKTRIYLQEPHTFMFLLKLKKSSHTSQPCLIKWQNTEQVWNEGKWMSPHAQFAVMIVITTDHEKNLLRAKKSWNFPGLVISNCAWHINVWT